ncbi:MBL fold metallo-hydrolase [Streptomyces sp. NPDC051976]|uniref:MBL fold metallo-hydrolase n=1 Tax=Streptomyces sp. NPDC051976 TaxID=3154947 RepID=UPI0034216AFF
MLTRTMQFGSVSITQVKELEEWRFPARNLYPNLSDASFERAVTEWGPRLADPATKELMLDINCFVVRTPEQVMLIDAGNGNDKHRPVTLPHHMFKTDFLDRLEAVGVSREDVEVVVATHLHQDHCGWNTMLVDGEWLPTFPRAAHLFSKRELRHVADYGRTAPDGTVERDFYRTFEDTIQPVLLAGLARTLSDGQTLFEDGQTKVWIEEMSGHTPGHLMVHVQSGTDRAVISGDAIHHPLQFADLGLAQVGDVDPDRAADVRRGLVETCYEHNALLLTAHFPGPGRVVKHTDSRWGFAWL